MARWHSSLGSMLWQLGHLAGARAQYERTLTIEGAVLGAGSSKAGAGHRPQQHQSYRQEFGDHSVQRIGLDSTRNGCRSGILSSLTLLVRVTSATTHSRSDESGLTPAWLLDLTSTAAGRMSRAYHPRRQDGRTHVWGVAAPGRLLHQLHRCRPGLGRVDCVAAGGGWLHHGPAGLGLPARQRLRALDAAGRPNHRGRLFRILWLALRRGRVAGRLRERPHGWASPSGRAGTYHRQVKPTSFSPAVPSACHIGRYSPVPSGQPRSLPCRP
jgi:hypothetical protein